VRLALPQVRVRPQTALRALPYLIVAIPGDGAGVDRPAPAAARLPVSRLHAAADPRHPQPAYGLADVYNPPPETEYLLYYVVGDLLAYVMGVKYASVAMMCLYLGGCRSRWPHSCARSTRRATRAVDHPLSVNVMFCMDSAVRLRLPMMLLALAAAVRHFEKPTRRSGAVVAVLTVLTFYAHIMPFALFGVGCIALFRGRGRTGGCRRRRRSFRGLCSSPGGCSRRSRAGPSRLRSAHAAPAAALRAEAVVAPGFFDRWSLETFRDQSNDHWAIALALVALMALGLSAVSATVRTRWREGGSCSPSSASPAT